VALKDSRLRTTLLVGTLCLLLAAGTIVWVVMRHRAIRIRQEAAATLLRDSLIRDRQQLNDRNLDLVRQLSDIQATHENTCNLDSIMESLQQSLFSKEDAERFRQNFSAVYPTALNRLRSRCPDLTYSDELFCMLAMLQLDNFEMARTLGISKSSVSKTRYRIRIKLGLPEGADVDTEIRKVMSVKE
jgi:type II secretory pathway pseudopilin PulG